MHARHPLLLLARHLDGHPSAETPWCSGAVPSEIAAGPSALVWAIATLKGYASRSELICARIDLSVASGSDVTPVEAGEAQRLLRAMTEMPPGAAAPEAEIESVRNRAQQVLWERFKARAKPSSPVTAPWPTRRSELCGPMPSVRSAATTTSSPSPTSIPASGISTADGTIGSSRRPPPSSLTSSKGAACSRRWRSSAWHCSRRVRPHRERGSAAKRGRAAGGFPTLDGADLSVERDEIVPHAGSQRRGQVRPVAPVRRPVACRMARATRWHPTRPARPAISPLALSRWRAAPGRRSLGRDRLA